MKNKKIYLISLVILFSASTMVFAKTSIKAVTAYVNDGLKMTFNGEPFTPKEDNGAEIKPIIYNNRSYLPLRTIAEKTGLVIDWDKDDNTICIKTKDYIDSLDSTLNFPPNVKKPVIYLYPEKKQDIYVRLDYNGNLITTYPAYNNAIKGWNVTAYPDGRLINHADNREYTYLFWDGRSESIQYDLSEGFVVEGKDTAKFLQDTLSKMGMLPKEYNEFIVYWLPQMQNNKYNLIHFAGKEYTESAKLEVTPKPDSVLRVFMVFKPLDHKIEVKPQKLEGFKRKGFSVIEWGGTEIEE